MKNRSGGDWKAILAALFCHIFWGFSFLASRTALNSAQVFVLLSHRFLLSFLLLNLIPGQLKRLRAQKPGKRQLAGLVLLGLLQPVLYFFGEQFGLLHSTTIFSGVMIAMIPVASTLAAAPILKEKPSALQLLFALLSVGGVIGVGLMSKNSGALEPIGVAALILAVLSAAGYTLLARSLSKSATPFSRTYAMTGVGAAVFTVLALIRCRGDLGAYLAPFSGTPYLLSVLYLSLFCSALCFFLSHYAITRLSVARETVFSNLTTAVSVFAGAVFLHEPFSAIGVLCCLMILVGIYGVQKAAPERKARSK